MITPILGRVGLAAGVAAMAHLVLGQPVAPSGVIGAEEAAQLADLRHRVDSLTVRLTELERQLHERNVIVFAFPPGAEPEGVDHGLADLISFLRRQRRTR